LTPLMELEHMRAFKHCSNRPKGNFHFKCQHSLAMKAEYPLDPMVPT